MRAATLLLLLLATCAGPPPEAYVGGSAAGPETGLGKNISGEACTQQAQGSGAAIFCGTWKQPSGHVARGGPASPAALATLAAASTWRSGLDGRFNCAAPTPGTILGGAPALLLSCTRQVGGWPQAALVAVVDGNAYFADGILPALPVLERSIGVLSGRVSAEAAPSLPAGQADALLAQRLAAQSFGAGDIGQFQLLMLAGARANLAESYAAAEQAYRAALDLQRRVLGQRDPNTAVSMMHLALQLSDEGRSVEADALFAEAAPLAARAADATALPRLQHYRALAKLNDDRPGEALPLLQAAEAGYAALLPAELMALRPDLARTVQVAARSHATGLQAASNSPLLEPDQQTALAGVIEVRRYQAIALRGLGRPAEAQAMIRSAEALAAARGLRQRNLTARLSRTAATVEDAAEAGSGVAGMRLAARDFGEAQPGSRPLAQTELLRAAEAMRREAGGEALGLCRHAAKLLDDLRTGTSTELMTPCLAAYAGQAARNPADRQALLAEMFAASQLVQGSVTSQQIALASARLSAGARDPAVAAAIRRQQDAGLALADLERRREAQAQGTRDIDSGPAASAEDLAKQAAAAQAALADADAALQAAAPNYGQLVQEAASAADVLAALAPGEAFASMTLTRDGGWVFVLRDGTVSAAPAAAGSTAIAALVKRVRASVQPGASGPPPFDTEAAEALYADTLGTLAPQLEDLKSLVVAPSGPLLSIPFGLLLTGPADPAKLASAPWLVRRAAIAHVPAPANFVSLRRVAGTSRAAQPWFGFGDFHAVTLAQAEQSFPSSVCEDSARLFAGLPPLPFARRELTAAQMLLGGKPGDALEGAAFTAPRVLQQDLQPYRVLHFATHALLPTDLRCQSEPAIVTSGPAGARNASGALLTASDVMGMRLDADAVILSACNSAGPGGAAAGESLSGLARAFFYAGARALMVTHWSVNDQTTAFLVAGTLQRLRAGDPAGIAGALRGAQLALLDDAGRGLPGAIAHPFYWAPFALVGEGRGRTATAAAAQTQSMPAQAGPIQAGSVQAGPALAGL